MKKYIGNCGVHTVSFVFATYRSVDSLLDAGCVAALLEFGLCDERAFGVVDHHAGFVVVASAFLAGCVDVGLACAFDLCLVAGRLLRASVEFVFYSVAEVFDCLDALLVYCDVDLDAALGCLG